MLPSSARIGGACRLTYAAAFRAAAPTGSAQWRAAAFSTGRQSPPWRAAFAAPSACLAPACECAYSAAASLGVARRAAHCSGARASSTTIAAAPSAAPGEPAAGSRVGTPSIDRAAPPTAAADPAPSAPARLGMISRAVGVVREYGASAVVIYAALWLGPGVASYYALVAAGNFGLDAGVALAYLPTAASDGILSMVGVPPGGTLAPWHTSAVLAYLFTDVLELVRLPATIFLAPRLKRWLLARRGAAAAGGKGV